MARLEAGIASYGHEPMLLETSHIVNEKLRATHLGCVSPRPQSELALNNMGKGAMSRLGAHLSLKNTETLVSGLCDDMLSEKDRGWLGLFVVGGQQELTKWAEQHGGKEFCRNQGQVAPLGSEWQQGTNVEARWSRAVHKRLMEETV